MRTTTEIIEAVHNGEPATEEELRLCILSMRHTVIMAHKDHTRWSLDKSLPTSVRVKAELHWKSVNDGWNVPVDHRVPPESRPGHPVKEKRRAFAKAVWKKVTGEQP